MHTTEPVNHLVTTEAQFIVEAGCAEVKVWIVRHLLQCGQRTKNAKIKCTAAAPQNQQKSWIKTLSLALPVANPKAKYTPKANSRIQAQ